MNDFYANRYKKMILIPFTLFIIFLLLVFVYPGIQQGVDLTGGNVLIIRSTTSINEQELYSILSEEFFLKELKISIIDSPTGQGAWIQYSKDPFLIEVENALNNATNALSLDNEGDAINYAKEVLVLLERGEEEFVNAKYAVSTAEEALADYKEKESTTMQSTLIQKLGLGDNAEFQKREISPTLGEASFASSIWITLIGLILITGVIFIAFRQIVPSIAIIQAIIFDITAGLTGMAVLGIPFSLTTLPAILMLIGYSVDTNILLTSRVLNGRDSTPTQRATNSMKTGITMTLTTLVALLSMLVISYLYQIEVIYQISAVLFFGLIGDLFATWLLNAPIILLWFERKEKKRS